jgi:Flp pilus assembly protein TadG
MMSGGRERGQSLVELMAGTMFLLVLLAGIVDVGRALFAHVALLDAAEEGALYGSYEPKDANGIETRIRDITDGPIDFSDTHGVMIEVSYSGKACAGNLLRVRVSYEYTVSTPFMGTILGSQTFPLSASAESLILSPRCSY